MAEIAPVDHQFSALKIGKALQQDSSSYFLGSHLRKIVRAPFGYFKILDDVFGYLSRDVKNRKPTLKTLSFDDKKKILNHYESPQEKTEAEIFIQKVNAWRRTHPKYTVKFAPEETGAFAMQDRIIYLGKDKFDVHDCVEMTLYHEKAHIDARHLTKLKIINNTFWASLFVSLIIFGAILDRRFSLKLWKGWMLRWGSMVMIWSIAAVIFSYLQQAYHKSQELEADRLAAKQMGSWEKCEQWIQLIKTGELSCFFDRHPEIKASEFLSLHDDVHTKAVNEIAKISYGPSTHPTGYEREIALRKFFGQKV